MKDIKNLEFQKSSYSGSYGCVAVCRHNRKVLVTHSRLKKSFVEFTPQEWKFFILGVKDGEFDHFIE